MLQVFFELYHATKSVIMQLDGAKYTEMNAQIFSDNIVVAFRKHISDSDDEVTPFDIIDALNFSVFFQTMAMRKGLLLRGGITLGNMYFDDVFVYGTGLIEAYRLEKNRAKYPRVIVDDCIVQLWNNSRCAFSGIPDDFFCVSNDKDGEPYVDYLSVKGMDATDRTEIIRYGRCIVERTKKLPQYASKDEAGRKLREKMKWQTEYFSYIEEKYRKGAGNGK